MRTAELTNANAPIHRLPDDVLIEIFEASSNQRGIEVTLSQVTRRWRHISVNLSNLWSDIFITSFQPLDKLDTYLLRSQNRLLNIDLELDQMAPLRDDSEDGKDKSLTPCLIALISHVSRWRSFNVTFYLYPSLRQIVNALHTLSVPGLTHFGVRFRDRRFPLTRSDRRSFEGSIFNGGAPRLSHLEYMDVSIESCWPPLGASIRHLSLWTNIIVMGVSSARVMELLTSVPALTHLTIKDRLVMLAGDNLPNVNFPYLVSLEIDGPNVPRVCSAISCPALISLVLGDMRSNTTNALLAILKQPNFGQPKYPALTHLRFKFSRIIELNHAFLHTFPTVTHIFFSSCEDVGNVLSLIADVDESESGDSHALPNLKKLMITPFSPGWIQPLCDLVTARVRIGLPLESLILRQVDLELLKKIEFLRENLLMESMDVILWD